MIETIKKDDYVVRKKEYFQIYSVRKDVYKAYKIVNGQINTSKLYMLTKEEIRKITVVVLGADRKEMKRLHTPHFEGTMELDPSTKLSKIVDMNTNDFIIRFHCSYESRIFCLCTLAARISRVIELPYQRQRRIFKVKLNVKVID